MIPRVMAARVVTLLRYQEMSDLVCQAGKERVIITGPCGFVNDANNILWMRRVGVEATCPLAALAFKLGIRENKDGQVYTGVFQRRQLVQQIGLPMGLSVDALLLIQQTGAFEHKLDIGLRAVNPVQSSGQHFRVVGTPTRDEQVAAGLVEMLDKLEGEGVRESRNDGDVEMLFDGLPNRIEVGQAAHVPCHEIQLIVPADVLGERRRIDKRPGQVLRVFILQSPLGELGPQGIQNEMLLFSSYLDNL